ncbi:MAG: QacE family quaternary ammonium compound efflux SMR transporter [Zoogloeaceae bacterium]|jgi:small multidrug resistance pump|nr:QacE family quaternary ammonium compound efflux SMR transporter [Zoogloeaceae bacterium]
MHLVYLALAIVAEVVATTSLKACAGFTRFWPSCVVIAGYCLAFFFLSLVMEKLPVGVIYAIWSGAGIVLVTIAAWFLYGQRLDPPALLGIAFILAGVVVINVFSQSAPH